MTVAVPRAPETDAVEPRSAGVPGAPARRPGQRRRRRWPYLVPLALVVVLGTALTIWIAVSGGARPVGWRPDPVPPDAWDPRVADIVAFVEDQRGIPFLQPVAVEFLDEEDFAAFVTSDALDERDRERLERVAATLRAVGLLEGDVDLSRERADFLGAGVLGLYDTDEKVMVVRGDQLTPRVRTVLVHELTHALQDQHFELEATMAAVARDDGQGSLDAYRGLVEGDAVRVQRAFLATLSAEETQQMQDETIQDLRRLEAVDIPEVLVATQTVPYDLGPAFVQALLDSGGNAKVDEAFRDPPNSDADLLEPRRYLDGDRVDLPEDPELSDGEENPVRTTFGALDMLLTLGERVEPGLASSATAGYAGARAVLFERDGRSCIRIAVRGTDEAAATTIARAWTEWAAAMPAEVGATALARDRDVFVTSCDPGTEITGLTTGRGAEQLRRLAIEPVFEKQLQDIGIPPAAARCIVRGLLDKYRVEELAEAVAAGTATEIQAEARNIVLACRQAA